jgi:hypothetical protein
MNRQHVLTYKFGIGFNEYGSEETWRDTLYVLPISGSTRKLMLGFGRTNNDNEIYNVAFHERNALTMKIFISSINAVQRFCEPMVAGV